MGKKIQVSNIPCEATEQDLSIMFRKYGLVDAATIVRDPDTGASRRVGFVDMANSMDADIAINQLDRSQYNGQIVAVSEAYKPANRS